MLGRLARILLRRSWTGEFRRRPCAHLHLAADPAPLSEICEECVALGDTWPALRICLTCGYVGCCDRSRNRHSLKHFEQTGHPLIGPFGERIPWIWCRLDDALLDPPGR